MSTHERHEGNLLEVDSYERLEEVETRIIQEVRRYRTDVVLRFIKYALDGLKKENPVGNRLFPQDKGGLPEFIAAGIASFSIRHSNPYRGRDGFGWSELAELVNLVASYLLADPIGLDEGLRQAFYKENPSYMALRHVGAQFPFQVNTFGAFAQPKMLFGEMPKLILGKTGVPKFDLDNAFQTLTQVSLHDFIDVGFVTWVAAAKTNGFTRGYYEKAMTQGIHLPDDAAIVRVLNNVAVDADRFREKHEQLKEPDRRFRMYDFNPLIAFPVLRPWQQSALSPMDQDRMIAPIPDLVASRFSGGIFYQMANAYGPGFLEYFGHLFEAYIGRILRDSVPVDSLLSEEDIRRTYPERKGKVPDWIAVMGDVAVPIECKATRFSRAALATGRPELVHDSLKQLVKGVVQLHRFGQAVQKDQASLERFRACKQLLPVVVTFEPLYLVNSKLFSKIIDPILLEQGVSGFDFQVLSMQQLEILQPHLAAGQSLPDVLRRIKEHGFDSVLADLAAMTGRTYKDSFLYRANEEIYHRLGVPL